MTIYTKEKNIQDNEYLQKVFSIVPDLKMTVTRNSKIDGRMGCGLGYNVKLQVFNRSYNTVFNNSQVEGRKIPNPEGILYCTLSDARCYDDTRNFKDFCDEFGYDEWGETRYGEICENKQALRAYNACQRTYEALHRLFTSEQIEQLEEVFQDY